MPLKAVRILGYAGLLPFIGLVLVIQLSSTPNNFLAAESLAGYGAVIVAFLGAIHWGANLRSMSSVIPMTNSIVPTGERWSERNAWVWGIIPALTAWLALHLYIPVALLILAALLLIQLVIDKATYPHYFNNVTACQAFLKIRTHLTFVAIVCLAWGANAILFA
ncbi:MAG: DUF3429 domain-containing protein [Burkholderiales bacterium]|jgi:hypothetical protein|nr:DUF3429 domain-containing protein [Polynucleobacter sp.]MCX7245666.1 DUF3429 domain-containing protein [Burkholderiales bacterium]